MAFNEAGFRAAAIKSGYKAADIDKALQVRAIKQAQLNLAKQGVLDPAKLAESDPVVAQQAIQQGAVPQTKAADIKKADSSREVLNFINSLEGKYSEAGGGTFGVGPGARIKGAIAEGSGNLGLNDAASVYDDSKSGFAATLKSLTGDTGVLTDQDFERLSKLLPGLGSTKKESLDKFNQLRSQISAKYGGNQTQTTFKPKVENNRGALASILDVVAPKAVDLGEKAAGDLSTQLKTGEYKTVADLLFPKSSKDVGLLQDVAPAGIETGGNLLAGESLLKGAKNILGNITGGGAKLGTQREAAALAVEKPVSTKPILEAGDKYISRDPTAQRLWNDVLRPALEKQPKMSIPDLLKQNSVWNDAYTSAGKVGKTALAGLSDALARAGKQVIRDEAPEVAKITSQMAKRYALENTLSRFGPAAIGAGGGVVGATIVGKALGQKQ